MQSIQPGLGQIGRDQAIGIAGGAVAFIASFLPFVEPRSLLTQAIRAAEESFGFSIPGVGLVGSKALVSGGLWGILVPVAAIALAIGCAVQLRRMLLLVAFGLSTGTLGLVLGGGALGVGLFSGSLSFGFFLSTLGFGALVYSYTRRVVEIG